MASPGNSADFAPLISREQAGNAIGAALRLFVGRGRRYSVKRLSNGTGVKDRVIECAMCDPSSVDYRPLPQEALMSIMLFLGEDFANEWTALAQLGCYALPDPDDTPPPSDLAAESAEDTARLVRLATTGDDRGGREIRGIATRMVARGMRLRSLAA